MGVGRKKEIKNEGHHCQSGALLHHATHHRHEVPLATTTWAAVTSQFQSQLHHTVANHVLQSGAPSKRIGSVNKVGIVRGSRKESRKAILFNCFTSNHWLVIKRKWRAEINWQEKTGEKSHGRGSPPEILRLNMKHLIVELFRYF
jgi:hypothetical protein